MCIREKPLLHICVGVARLRIMRLSTFIFTAIGIRPSYCWQCLFLGQINPIVSDHKR